MMSMMAVIMMMTVQLFHVEEAILKLNDEILLLREQLLKRQFRAAEAPRVDAATAAHARAARVAVGRRASGPTRATARHAEFTERRDGRRDGGGRGGGRKEAKEWRDVEWHVPGKRNAWGY